MFTLLPFAFASLLPAALLLLASVFGGIWPALGVISITIVVFILDRRTGRIWKTPTQETGHTVSLCLAAMHFALLTASIWAISQNAQLSTLDKILIFTGTGLWLGQISNSNAHEMIHRSNRIARRMGIAIYCSLLFGHHASAHPKVHHIHVATDQDPNSARYGEGFYRFFLRAWVGGFKAGLHAENAQRKRAQNPAPVWQHPYVSYVSGAVATLFAAAFLGGIPAIAALCALAFYAQLQLLLSDYVQHYGLRRQCNENVRPVPVGPQHSWNAPHWYSSAMMLNAPRHSDHHMHPARSFPALELDADEMPILPHALPVMAVIALYPRLWRRVMDKRVAKWMAN